MAIDYCVVCTDFIYSHIVVHPLTRSVFDDLPFDSIFKCDVLGDLELFNVVVTIGSALFCAILVRFVLSVLISGIIGHYIEFVFVFVDGSRE